MNTKQIEEFINKWYSYGGSREIMESDLLKILRGVAKNAWRASERHYASEITQYAPEMPDFGDYWTDIENQLKG